jgi:plastocyanin
MRSRLMLFPLAALLACGGGGSDTTAPGGGGGGGGGGTAPTVTTAVTMQGNQFSPRAIRVSPSATVTWTNSDNTPHNASFANATIGKTSDFSSGVQSLAMPATPGTYTYTCTFHAGMSGTVQVQ